MAGADDPSGYVADEGLRDAVNVALVLGQPLLVTGEPGTGKTQLAFSVAYELELPAPVVFQTKTTSTAKDLFYRYDALRHFNDANIIKKDEGATLPVENYITYEALGRAIIQAGAGSEATAEGGRKPARSVVLMDEVDKAPRDFPNDILHEIEKFSFTVSETSETFVAEQSARPIVILTSNSEKNLPDAFLRRCVFYHIPPPNHEQLKQIALRRLTLHEGFPTLLDPLIEHFEEIRELALKKKPATAELLAWLRVLNQMKINEAALRQGQAEALAFTYSILAKNKEDKELIQSLRFKLNLPNP
ncbi:MAG: MoxR family ATPase [Rubrivivax sp.]|nr:MoxR family ATPase [Pyrinomonadaceae bacterium]